MTPLQRYRHKLAEQCIEQTLEEAQQSRRKLFAKVRQLLLGKHVPCPTDDDALQEWMEKTACDWDLIVTQPDE